MPLPVVSQPQGFVPPKSPLRPDMLPHHNARCSLGLCHWFTHHLDHRSGPSGDVGLNKCIAQSTEMDLRFAFALRASSFSETSLPRTALLHYQSRSIVPFRSDPTLQWPRLAHADWPPCQTEVQHQWSVDASTPASSSASNSASCSHHSPKRVLLTFARAFASTFDSCGETPF